MQVAIQTHGWYYRLFQGDENPEAAFQFIVERGFDSLDWNFDKYLPTKNINSGMTAGFFDATIQELETYFQPIKEAAVAAGIRFAQGHCPYPMYVPGMYVGEGMLTVTEKLLYVCRYLQCPALAVHPVRQLTMEENLELFARLIPAAKETGIMLCLENLFQKTENGYKAFCCGDDMNALVDGLNERAGKRVFGVCFDTGHATLCGLNPAEQIQKMGDRIRILHIHENNGIRDQHLIPYMLKQSDWKNFTDWESVLLALKQIGYQGTISFETHPALREVPDPLVPSVLRLIAEIGNYFRNRLQEQ